MKTYYIIVKYAKYPYWKDYFEYDPVRKGAERSLSVSSTYSGLSIGVKPIYENQYNAELDCKKINQFNSVGQYAVCPVIY